MKVLIFGCDPGGANVLLPVLKRLVEGGTEQVLLKIIGKDWAFDIWSKSDFHVQKWDANMRADDLISWADILLTATSGLQGVEISLWQTAEQQAKPSVAVLDFWAHYLERFTDRQTEQPFWPTKIAVMDEMAKQEMLNCGVPSDRLVVTGQPYLEMRAIQLQEKRGALPPGSVNNDEINILFVSQPIHILPGAKMWGYDEFQVLRCIVDALNELHIARDKQLKLMLRPHPRDDVQGLCTYFDNLQPEFKWCLDKSSDPDDALIGCKLVLGISSMLLVEAALLGKPVISVQPGLKSVDPFPLSRWGYCKRVEDAKSLRTELMKTINANPSTDLSPLQSFVSGNIGATDRIIRLLYSLSVHNFINLKQER